MEKVHNLKIMNFKFTYFLQFAVVEAQWSRLERWTFYLKVGGLSLVSAVVLFP